MSGILRAVFLKANAIILDTRQKPVGWFPNKEVIKSVNVFFHAQRPFTGKKKAIPIVPAIVSFHYINSSLCRKPRRNIRILIQKSNRLPIFLRGMHQQPSFAMPDDLAFHTLV